MRLWATLFGVIVGSAIGGIFGLYDVDRAFNATWIGIPQSA